MFEYVICNQPDASFFTKQCEALKKNIPHLEENELLEDVDFSLIQRFSHPNGTVTVKNDMQVGALYILSDFDLNPFFK